MIKFTFNGEQYSLRNTPEELTNTEFDYITAIINDTDRDYIDKFMEVFVYLGLPQDIVDDMDGKTFIQLSRDFMNYQYESTWTKEIEIDGYTYKAFDDEKYVPRIKDLKMIEKFIKQSPNKYAAKVMAVIFKRTDLTKAEHYDDAHIKHKAELFANQPYSIILPYVAVVLDQITTNLKNTAENEVSE